MNPPLIQEVIRKKRDGIPLSQSEIGYFIAGVCDETIPDYQVAAMLMATTLRGMTEQELTGFANAMIHSGEVLDLSHIAKAKIDKHSTGGVGDKISIPLAPAVAACGVVVPMISGRGLGHTGGTLDKLESIPGFRVDLTTTEFMEQIARLGTCLIGQTDHLAPADRRLYAMRDVTATVESIPLIASSIMSKKLAEGIDGLVLDCKVGQGAFMKNRDDAIQLAKAIQTIGRGAGKKVTVVLTAMDTPIGYAVGNAIEIVESIEVLQGGGPADTRMLTIELGAQMLLLAEKCQTVAEAKRQIQEALDSGSALALFGEVIEAQGGNPYVLDDPKSMLPQAMQSAPVCAVQDGYVTNINAQDIGIASVTLGGGRHRKEDLIDPSVGIHIDSRVGDRVSKGQPLAHILHNTRGFEQAKELVTNAYTVTDSAPEPSPLILEILP